MFAAPRISAALIVLGAVSCSGRGADFYLHDTGVLIETSAPFAAKPDLSSRVESTVGAALAYWGGDWSALAGRSITLSGASHVSCGDNDSALGCYDGDVRITTKDPATGTFNCVEQTVLVHEIGHAVIGDPLHQDPRWMQLDPVRDALSGRVGYTADREVDCTVHVSVWRHPIGVP